MYRSAGGTTSRRKNASPCRTTAPSTTPNREPIPPKITMVSTRIEACRLNVCGLKNCLVAKSTPAKPDTDAPIENASSFIRTVATPEISAANSSSRIAAHARPTCDRSSRPNTTITTITTASSR